MKEKEEDEEAEEDPPLPLLTLPIESAIKWPIMDGFQILRCLWKRLDKMLQSTQSASDLCAAYTYLVLYSHHYCAVSDQLIKLF